jgi:hypothetical protein
MFYCFAISDVFYIIIINLLSQYFYRYFFIILISLTLILYFKTTAYIYTNILLYIF